MEQAEQEIGHGKVGIDQLGIAQRAKQSLRLTPDFCRVAAIFVARNALHHHAT